MQSVRKGSRMRLIRVVGIRFGVRVLLLVVVAIVASHKTRASDHLDTPTVIADPAADIGDIFTWTSSDGRRLNLVMDIVAHQFSNKLQYVFHLDSGPTFGMTTASLMIVCRFDIQNNVECWAGNEDYVHGDAHSTTGLESEGHRFRIFTGLRDDPFFNNVKGARAAYTVAGAAIQHGAAVDGAGCPHFDVPTVQSILNTWRKTDGGPAKNFLAGWKTSAIVISIDLDMVTNGGKFAAVWATVHRVPRRHGAERAHPHNGHSAMPILGEVIERTARPLIKTALVGGPLVPDADSNRRKEAYNRVSRNGWEQFSRYIEQTLALYDGFDGRCGNQWLADTQAPSSRRYAKLGRILADDRIWVNTASSSCTQFLAVELAAVGSAGAQGGECGGRTPTYDASNIFRSLLTNGTTSGFDDGLHQDEIVPSTSEFPFLAAP